ncbi:MAG: thioredoxin-disulfide reductase [Desulfotomaculaceae bacterium]|nr:thioredoxin-disulfide reductase [Desulfotomaculaceae bacterium]
MKQRDLVIIGGGPAGLTAGIYAARAALNTVLLERGVPGGLVVSTESIENYPGFIEGINGAELMSRMEDQARRFGLEIASFDVNGLYPSGNKFIIKTSSGDITAGAIIIATGVEPSQLHVKGEAELIGRGVSFCATCDGPFFRGKRVAVVGGGDAAVEEAVYLTKFAEKVLIVHRRGELRATRVVQQKAFDNAKVEFIWHNVIDEIHGDDTVEAVTVKDVRDGKKNLIPVDGAFIYVGNVPVSGLVKDLVKLNEQGYIITDENMHTSHPGIFAAGDVRDKLLRQVVTAMADGAIAAVAAEKHLEKQG